MALINPAAAKRNITLPPPNYTKHAWNHVNYSLDMAFVTESWKSASEGRILYLGNLSSEIVPSDILIWLEAAGLSV